MPGALQAVAGLGLRRPRRAGYSGSHRKERRWPTGSRPRRIASKGTSRSYPGFAMSTHLAIPFLGLVLVDNTNPERLARACAEEGLYEFLFTATPIRLVGSTGAPVHPLAIF